MENQQQTYVIKYMDKEMAISVQLQKDKQEERFWAFAKFFKTITDNKTSLEELGSIITSMKLGETDEGNMVAFRVTPLLWKMGYIGTKLAVDNLISVFGGSRKSAKRILKDCAEKDADLIPYIEQIHLREAR